MANNSTGSGTVTDAAGAFTVQAATGQLLTISCVGYTSWTVKVPASGAIDVELSEDAQQLDDVVVVGYATQKKINVTGAVSSISGEELAQRPVVSTMQALQGIDPSLNISIDSGNPTAGNSLNIRGVPSINGGSPLILVDGVPGVSLRLVNAADIESISVLKDASSQRHLRRQGFGRRDPRHHQEGCGGQSHGELLQQHRLDAAHDAHRLHHQRLRLRHDRQRPLLLALRLQRLQLHRRRLGGARSVVTTPPNTPTGRGS